MSIKSTVKLKECVSCGACSGTCPKNAIKMIYNEATGFYFPDVSKACVECHYCETVCPVLCKKSSNSLVGRFDSIGLYYSLNPQIRHWSTSGGVVNSIIRYLIEENVVDLALVIRNNPSKETESSVEIINQSNIHNLNKNPRDYASRYIVYPILEVINKIEVHSRVAMVGTPCQIRAMRNIEKNNKKFESLVLLGITCSGGISYKATELYKERCGLPNAIMYYRGDGWPGQNSVIKGEAMISSNHNGSMFERMFSSQIFKNKGCRYCDDHFAELADISFCDYWNNEEIKTEREGKTCTIVRSERGREILNGAIRNKYIEASTEISESELIKSQLHAIKSKKGKVNSMISFRLFCVIVDLVFKTKIYRLFDLRVYNWFSSIYRNICLSTNISNEKGDLLNDI